MRTIAHLDMDAFYASIELTRRPELKGKAMVVAGSGPRSVITTASYEARAQYGIGSAMPLSRALRLCRDLIVVKPDFETYRSVSKKVMSILRKHVEVVEVMGLDEAYLDLTGYLMPKSAMQLIRTEIKEQTQLTCSVGIGPNKLIAKIASGLDKPVGTVIMTQQQAQENFTQSSPGIIPGIGPKTVKRLADLSITSIADLSRRSVEELQSIFGPQTGQFLARRALFEDDNPVEPERPTKSVSSELTFDVDIAERAEQTKAILDLSDSVASRLAAKSLRGRNISIKVRLNNWTTVTRARTIDAVTGDSTVIRKIALELFNQYNPERPVRLLGVRVGGFEEEQSTKRSPNNETLFD